jgi:hypothetical protein
MGLKRFQKGSCRKNITYWQMYILCTRPLQDILHLLSEVFGDLGFIWGVTGPPGMYALHSDSGMDFSQASQKVGQRTQPSLPCCPPTCFSAVFMQTPSCNPQEATPTLSYPIIALAPYLGPPNQTYVDLHERGGLGITTRTKAGVGYVSGRHSLRYMRPDPASLKRCD